jgi:hypothetical protein
MFRLVLIITLAIVFKVLPRVGLSESKSLLVGWILGATELAANAWIMRSLKRVSPQGQLQRWLALTLAKFLGLIVAVSVILFFRAVDPVTFVVAFLVAYFIFFVYHVCRLRTLFFKDF